MKKENFLWGETQKWLERYGVLERVIKVQRNGEDNSASRGSKKRENVRRRPGVSPLVYSKFLLGNTVFLQLDDISEKLPALIENVVGVKMNPELEAAYNLLEQTIGSRVREEMAASGNSTLLGTYLLSLLAYTDKPYKFGPVIHPSMKSSILPEIRMDWVNEKVKQGYQIIIGNPELVKTGLDLLDFPTLIFYQTGYNTFTLSQASRRSWRIGQKNDVKIFYLFYQSTMQEKCLSLMGAKLEASIGIEGKFSEEEIVDSQNLSR